MRGDLGGYVPQSLELPGRGVDAVDVHGAVAVGRLVVGGDHDVAAQVDVVAVVAGDALDPGAGHVVDLQRALLVRGDDHRFRGVGRVDPDGGIVGGVAAVRDRGGLHGGGDGGGRRVGGSGRQGQCGQDGCGQGRPADGGGEGHRFPLGRLKDRRRVGRPGERRVNGS